MYSKLQLDTTGKKTESQAKVFLNTHTHIIQCTSAYYIQRLIQKCLRGGGGGGGQSAIMAISCAFDHI